MEIAIPYKLSNSNHNKQKKFEFPAVKVDDMKRSESSDGIDVFKDPSTNKIGHQKRRRLLSQHVRPVENKIEIKSKNVSRKESSSGPMRKKSIASVSSSENGMSSLTLDKLGIRGKSKFA